MKQARKEATMIHASTPSFYVIPKPWVLHLKLNLDLSFCMIAFRKVLINNSNHKIALN